MAEQLAAQERFRKTRAVHGDERFIFAMARGMNRPGDQLLTGPGFTLDQHGRVHPRHVADLLVYLLHGFALSQQIVKLRPLVEKAAEVMNFRDIIEKEDFSARVPGIVLNVYFEPDATAIASVEVKRNPAALLCRLFAQCFKFKAVVGVQTE